MLLIILGAFIQGLVLAEADNRQSGLSSAYGPSIISDQADYYPGSLVTLTGSGWEGDESVTVVVTDYDFSSEPWSFEQTVPVAPDGTISLQFKLPDWYVPLYLVTAAGQTTGRVATATFTDDPRAYTIDLSAYKPTAYDYKFPSDFGYPSSPVLPIGRSNDWNPLVAGRQEPIPVLGLITGDRTVESLMPKDLALGQIIPYELRIDVGKFGIAPENGVIRVESKWSSTTTSGSLFGYDDDIKVLAAFVDAADPLMVDPEADATVTGYTEGMAANGFDIVGTFTVSGLDVGDTVVVEVWMVLDDTIDDPAVTGNIPSILSNAETVYTPPGAISTGNQNVPLLQAGDFLSATADVSITKSDAPDPVQQGSNLTYTITATNNSLNTIANGIVVTDTLDPNVTFVSASDGGVYDSMTHTVVWPAFPLDIVGHVNNQKNLTVTVRVKDDAPTQNFTGTSPDTRTSISTNRLAGSDITNIVGFTMATSDPNTTNNRYQVPTNILPNPLGDLGDFVWYDLDMDGIQDAGEPGIPGVTVNLYASNGTTLIDTTTTGSNGRYSFIALGSDSYILEFIKPDGYNASPQNQGTNDALDSDTNVLTGRTAVIVYTISETNITYDSGYWTPPASISIDKQTSNGTETGDGIEILEGSPVTWIYTVTNSGSEPLHSITVTDDKGVVPVYQSGDNGDGVLGLTETWIYRATGTAVSGPYTNIGTADSTESAPASDASDYIGYVLQTQQQSTLHLSKNIVKDAGSGYDTASDSGTPFIVRVESIPDGYSTDVVLVAGQTIDLVVPYGTYRITEIAVPSEYEELGLTVDGSAVTPYGNGEYIFNIDAAETDAVLNNEFQHETFFHYLSKVINRFFH